jgi:DNA (cytosine-5)-methyltransferase 1
MSKIKLFSMFSGYGGAEWGLKKAGLDYECVGYSEIDKYAIKCYENNFPGIKNYGDATKIIPNMLPDFNLLTGGFPCQPFSMAGKREGFDNVTKGTLFYDILRIAEVKKPRYMLLENVKGLLSINNGRTFSTIIYELKKIGYDVAYKVLNSKDYNIPQNRERIWLVCKLGKWEFMEFMFPNKLPLTNYLKDILESNVDKRYYLTNEQVQRIQDRNRFGDHLYENVPKVHNCLCAIGASDVAIIKIADYRNDEGIRIRTDNCTPCLTANLRDTSEDLTKQVLLKNKEKWRRLTPKECFRLMGFLEDEINLNDISNNQKYKLAGNGWDVNLVSKIFKRLYNNHGHLNSEEVSQNGLQ